MAWATLVLRNAALEYSTCAMQVDDNGGPMVYGDWV